ncbi:MAG TPA: hypothetical protein DET40_17060 [Lentisphaeria bacterium]|nr:MAG: hypothetical protein A2X45_02945 [Lentisphaerae bacterium GWF2_50_93]HCE45251.1 hypothetical protein [Lentisphaeria bacterium]
MNKNEQHGRLLPLGRAFNVLRICASKPDGASFSELLKAISPATPAALSRLLKAMAYENIIVKDVSGAYRTGPLMHEISRKLKGETRIEEAVKPFLNALASDTKRSAAYFELGKNGAFLIGKSEVSEDFHYIDLFKAMGSPAAHGFGQILMSFGNQQIRKLFDPDGLFMDDAKYLKRLEEIRNGLCFIRDWGKDNVIYRLASPVFSGRKIMGTVGLSFRAQAPDKKEIARTEPFVKNIAERISRLYEGNNVDV